MSQGVERGTQRNKRALRSSEARVHSVILTTVPQQRPTAQIGCRCSFACCQATNQSPCQLFRRTIRLEVTTVKKITRTSPFDRIRRLDEQGVEYWSARDLARVFGYTRWATFPNVIAKAERACEGSGYIPSNQFRRTTKLIQHGKGAQREIDDWWLSRYACYLVAQNADSSKATVAQAQTYFAVQTRRQELADAAALEQSHEDEQRVRIRQQVVDHNKSLSAAAQQAGVTTGQEFARFHDAGYRGLYGGMGKAEIAAQRGLPPKGSILDHMGSTELAANLFRATQAEDKLKRDRVRGTERANDTHRKVGAVVREAIRLIGGTMPEALPTPAESIAKLKQRRKRVTTAITPRKVEPPKRRKRQKQSGL